MHHSFDIQHASKYGIPEAVMIANFQWWIVKNAANGKHQHEGRTWTYNSAKAFEALMPYMSNHQVRRTLDSLVEQGVIMKGNFNENPYDRTLWFAFVDESWLEIPNHHLADLPNTNGDAAKSNTDINQILPLIPQKGWTRPEWIPADAWKGFEELRRKMRKPLTDRARTIAVNKLEKLRMAGQDVQAVIDQTIEHSWDTFYAVKTEQQRNGYGKPAHDGKTDEYGVLL